MSLTENGRLRRTTLFAVAGLGGSCALCLAACAPSSAVTAPQTVTGDPAKVQNKADALLPSGAQPWDSGTLNTDQTFAHRFDTPGEYTYTSLPAEGQGLVGRISVH